MFKTSVIKGCFEHSCFGFVSDFGFRVSDLALPLVLLALLSSAGLAQEPLYTSKAKFRIPFQFEPEEMARLQAVEIRLFVSTDSGKNWNNAAAVTPQEGRFTFAAPEEGEYWFSVRTIDARNQQHPSGLMQPGLKVIVDQTDPQLQLRLTEGTPGEAQLSWQADDDHLDASTLKLEHFDAASQLWKPVPMPADGVTQTSWPVTQPGRIFVRGTVADHAGNIASADVSTTISRAGQPRPQVPKPDFSQPVADGARPGEIADANPAPESTANRGDSLTAKPVAGSQMPQIIGRSPEPDVPDEPEIKSQRINARTFNLAYELVGLGPAGVKQVELFMTKDGGKEWSSYGVDDDRTSPIVVSVPEDGAYGFAIRIETPGQATPAPPQPGERPAMIVDVDETLPQARLLPVRQDGNAIEIAWEASDARLADRPVALFYAPTPEGPWQPMTDWQENKQQYRWMLTDGVPRPLYLRLDVRDAAGNITQVTTAEPLLADQAAPKARIVDVEKLPAADPQQ